MALPHKSYTNSWYACLRRRLYNTQTVGTPCDIAICAIHEHMLPIFAQTFTQCTNSRHASWRCPLYNTRTRSCIVRIAVYSHTPISRLTEGIFWMDSENQRRNTKFWPKKIFSQKLSEIEVHAFVVPRRPPQECHSHWFSMQNYMYGSTNQKH